MYPRFLIAVCAFLAVFLAVPLSARASDFTDELEQLYEAEEYGAVADRLNKSKSDSEVLEAYKWLENIVARGAPYNLIFLYAQLSWAYAEGLNDETRREMAAAHALYLAIALTVDSAKCTDQAAAQAQLAKFRSLFYRSPAIEHLCTKPAARRPLVRDIAQKYEFFLRGARAMDPTICAKRDEPDAYLAREATAIVAIPQLLDVYLPLRGGC
jgi:hypothetical protein